MDDAVHVVQICEALHDNDHDPADDVDRHRAPLLVDIVERPGRCASASLRSARTTGPACAHPLSMNSMHMQMCGSEM
jgi:hypothetical protein